MEKTISSGNLRGLELKLPIYVGKNPPKLLGMNWYSNAHYRTANAVKQEYHKAIGKILPKDFVCLKSPVRTSYRLYYKNKLSDANNIISITEKFLLDALQEHGIIVNDNVQHYIKSSWEVVEQDRDNPRVEVLIEEIECF